MLYEWLQHIEFKYNWVLPFLLLLPVLAWIRGRSSKAFSPSMTVSSAHSFTARSGRNTWLSVQGLLRLLALACLLLAAARPQLKQVQQKAEGQGIAIMLCMDVSGSMLSQDFVPSRLEVAKEVAAEFVQARPVDQIGLVVFAGESFTQFPLSTDREGLLEQIRNVRSGMLEDGTLIGEGLATAVQRLSAVPATSKVIILLTDGREEAPDTRIIEPATALNLARAQGIKVYTVGMGSDRALPASEAGRGRRFDRNTAFIDETLLRKIGTQTGGAYFRARDRESLAGIYDRIDRLEKSEVEIITKIRYSEEYQPFVAVALLLLLIELLLRFLFLRTFP